MKICFIHGNGASADSFNFLRGELAHDNFIDLEYDSRNGFAANLADMAYQLEHEPCVFFVAHSLGGLYALHLADRLGARAAGAVTMATPFGGSEVALALNMFKPQQVFMDIHSHAYPVMHGRDIKVAGHWTSIVTTKGHSRFMAAANDGVCTLNSMYDRRGVKFVEVAATHHECLLNREVAGIVRSAIAECQERAA